MILRLWLAIHTGWLQRHQQRVITYLHEENHVLKAQLRGRRLRLTDTERCRLATLAYQPGRRRLQSIHIIHPMIADGCSRLVRVVPYADGSGVCCPVESQSVSLHAWAVAYRGAIDRPQHTSPCQSVTCDDPIQFTAAQGLPNVMSRWHTRVARSLDGLRSARLWRSQRRLEMCRQHHMRGNAGLTLLFSRETIAARVRELGEQINRNYMGQEILLVGVLKGAFVFLADLMRTLQVTAQVEFVRLASYGTGMVSEGHVRVTQDLEGLIVGRHVLVVEDILDTGLTLSVLLQQLQAREPASLKLCVLLNKRITRQYEITPDYVGFDVPDGFVVGYGIDYAEDYRQLPDIYALTIATPRS
jgi:hypoxanthine phosphoribosyltransferase